MKVKSMDTAMLVNIRAMIQAELDARGYKEPEASKWDFTVGEEVYYDSVRTGQREFGVVQKIARTRIHVKIKHGIVTVPVQMLKKVTPTLVNLTTIKPQETKTLSDKPTSTTDDVW